MEGLKSLGKCVGRACGLQSSEFHNVFDELKNIAKLGVNTQTRKNRLSRVGARLNSLAATRAMKTNLAKINSLRLAHDVLNAQRTNAVLNSSNLMRRYQELKSRKNKHETDRLVEGLLEKEIRPIRKIRTNTETALYLSNLQRRSGPVVNERKAKVQKTLAIVQKQFPLVTDDALLKMLVNERLLALQAEVTDEDEVSRDPRKAAAVMKFFNERISRMGLATNITMSRVAPGAAGAGTGSARRNRRTTRKASRRKN